MPTIQQPNDLLTAITRIEGTSKMREHLQVVAKECSKPIAKCVQLNTEDQTSLPRALETFIAKTVRGSKTCCVEAVEARSKRYDQADLAMIRQNRRRRRRETELIPVHPREDYRSSDTTPERTTVPLKVVVAAARPCVRGGTFISRFSDHGRIDRAAECRRGRVETERNKQ